MILFCLPYAGGSARDYYYWGKKINSEVKVFTIELRNRGKRIAECPYTNFDEMVIDVANQIYDVAGNEDYAIFGHSMGCILAYCVSVAVDSKGGHSPLRLFLSGRDSPMVEYDKSLGVMDDDEIIQYISGLKGKSMEILSDPRIGKAYINRIRNDYRILTTYKSTKYKTKLSIRSIIFYGSKDVTIHYSMDEWGSYIGSDYEIYDFKSGHFYSEEQLCSMCEIINRELLKLG